MNIIESLFDNTFNLFNLKKSTKGLTLIIIHYLTILSILFYLIFGKVNMLFYFITVFLVFVFIINIIYKGCPLIRLERKYINNKEWYGIYHSYELINIKPNKNNMKLFSYSSFILFTSIIIYRLSMFHFFTKE